MSKKAIVVMSDPSAGDEALGRLFNALILTADLKRKDHDVALIFQGAGTRWSGELLKADHPANAAYAAVQDKVAGASAGCAAVFGATDAVRAADIALVQDREVPGGTGMLDLSRYVDAGYELITF